MENTSIDYLHSKISEVVGESLSMEQRSKLKAVFEDAKAMHKEELKRICFNTLETCDDIQSGSLNDYFELNYNQLFNKQ